MNPTEKNAYQWLLTKGLTPAQIKFKSTNTVDFETPIGRFEVKQVFQKKCIFISNRQAPLFAKDTSIRFLIFEKGTKIPLEMSFAEVKAMYTIYGPSKDTCNFMQSLPEQWFDAIDKLVKAGYCTSVQDYVREAVRKEVLPLLQVEKKQESA